MRAAAADEFAHAAHNAAGKIDFCDQRRQVSFRARQIGLRLVHARKSWGEVAVPGVARIALDVTGDGEGGTVSPVIGVDGGFMFDYEVLP